MSYVKQEIEALALLAKRRCKAHKGDVSCAETDVPVEQYCGPCYCRAKLNELTTPVKEVQDSRLKIFLTKKNCHDCGAKPGEQHVPGCDTERCPNCGGQIISCGCPSEEVEKLKPLPWTGIWPGTEECVEFSWFSRMTPGGWMPCTLDALEAGPDLNRLYRDAKWDKKLGRFVKK